MAAKRKQSTDKIVIEGPRLVAGTRETLILIPIGTVCFSNNIRALKSYSLGREYDTIDDVLVTMSLQLVSETEQSVVKLLLFLSRGKNQQFQWTSFTPETFTNMQYLNFYEIDFCQFFFFYNYINFRETTLIIPFF